MRKKVLEGDPQHVLRMYKSIVASKRCPHKSEKNLMLQMEFELAQADFLEINVMLVMHMFLFN